MPDQTPFEARLTDAYARYVAAASVAVDPRIVAATVAAGSPSRSLGWPNVFTLGRRVAVAAVIAVLVVGGTFYLIQRDQLAVGGPSPTPGASASPSESASPSAGPSPSVVAPRAASWIATGSMGTARLGHVATLLRDGRVLVAGGFNKECACAEVDYASAELYDPATGTWTATGSMVEPHAYAFTLTQLADGRVLAAGRPTSELYDPSTGTWTVTGKMVADDASLNATLLPDGRVLVAGGGGGGSVTCNGCAPRSSAELYDPASGTWTAAANMTRPRSAPTATLLPDGKVLVAGGDPPTDQPEPPGPSTAELYDPVTGSWTATGSMATTAMVSSTGSATLLPDGKVLVLGLTSSSAPSAELYDPASGTWAVTGKMVAADYIDTTTLLLDGKVLVLGLTSSSAPTAELYDPASGTWAVTSSVLPPRCNACTATLLSDGRVLVAGGALPAGPVADHLNVAITAAELYDPGSSR